MCKRLIVLLTLLLASQAYAVKLIPNGSTSQSISVVFRDSDNDPNTAITPTDLDIYLQIDGPGAQATKVDCTALASADAAWSSGKAIHKGNGVYRIDIPDANLSDGVGTLLTYVIDNATTPSTYDIAYYEVQLTDASFFTGLSTLLTRIYETLGLSEIGDKVQADMDANSVDLNTIITDTSAQDTEAEVAAISSVLVDNIVAAVDANSSYIPAPRLLSTTATSATHTTLSVTVAAGWAVNDAYDIGCIVVVTDADAATLPVSRRLKQWTSGRVLTFTNPLPFTPANGDTVEIYADISVKKGRGIRDE